jgi:hypothetical protein
MNMNPSEFPRPRPYWHVDAKWITGILLLFLLSATFFTFILARITAPEQGIELLAVILANSFSREGLDQEADMEIMREKIAESPNGAWQPIPNLNIVVREEDIADLSPREMRLWFFRQLAEPIYYDGGEGLASLSTDPEVQDAMMDGELGAAGFISAETYGKLNRAFMILGSASLVLLGLLVYFSHRFGRLGSPGCVIFLAALPGIILFSMLRGWLENAAQAPDPEAEATSMTAYVQTFNRMAADALPGVVENGLQIYLSLAALGLGLLLLALIGTLVAAVRKRARSSA